MTPPRLTWPGVLELDVRSTAPFWVVFDERDDALCVEPQTAPPDAFNLAWAAGVEPPIAAPDRPGVDRDGVALVTTRPDDRAPGDQAFEATPFASGTFTPVTRFLPARLLVYIARSALIISSSAVCPSSG